ncbi:hypothetical protein [Streptomyces sp. NPDC023838]|uniref:hypothetical protein n=1 Tax=Streptomyces sp. NPDC023838 TaxID=3154325 RepID=UPI0033F11171
MNAGAAGLSLAGLAITLGVLYANIRPWWKGSRDPKQLAPFGLGALLGAMSTMCAGGLLGWLSGCAPRVANSTGDKAVSVTTGSASSAPLPRGSLGALSPDGAVIVFLATVVVVLAWRAAGKADKKRILGGAWCGACLCITAGVASLLNSLPSLVNQAGAQLHALVAGGAL